MGRGVGGEELSNGKKRESSWTRMDWETRGRTGSAVGEGEVGIQRWKVEGSECRG
jgi:hypothetical protein